MAPPSVLLSQLFIFIGVLGGIAISFPFTGCEGYKYGKPFGDHGVFQRSRSFFYSVNSTNLKSLMSTSNCLIAYNNTAQKKATRCFTEIENRLPFYIYQEISLELTNNGTETTIEPAYIELPEVKLNLQNSTISEPYLPELNFKECVLGQERLNFRGFSDVVQITCIRANETGYAETIYARATSWGCRPLLSLFWLSVDDVTYSSVVDYLNFLPLSQESLQLHADSFEPFTDMVKDLFF